jgi:hypothetical protein
MKLIKNPRTKRPIAHQTFHAVFADEIESGRSEIDALIAGSLVRAARQGNVVACIWLSKNLWAWKDTVERINHSRNAYVELSAEDLARGLRERGLPTQVFPPPKFVPVNPQLGNGHDATDDDATS